MVEIPVEGGTYLFASQNDGQKIKGLVRAVDEHTGSCEVLFEDGLIDYGVNFGRIVEE